MSSDRLIITRLVPVLDFGGVESRLVLQAQLLDRERFDLRICTFWKPGAAADAIRALGLSVDVLGVDPSIRNLQATAALYQYLRQVRPHVLHASVAEAMWHGALAGALAGVPWRLIEDVGMPQRSPLAQLMFGAASRLAHRVIGVSQATCDYLITHERMPAERVRLIYNCGKPQYFGPTTRHQAEARPFRVLTAGRLVPVKNQLALVEAFGQLVERHPQAQLWIAGEGELREALQARIDALGLTSQATLLGFRQDVRALLDQSDVFVLPSHSEGCSIALIEAMATGIPVLGSTASGICEVMGELGASWMVPAQDVSGLGQALIRLADLSPEQRDALGLQARQIALRRFSPEVYMNNLQAIYLDGASAT